MRLEGYNPGEGVECPGHRRRPGPEEDHRLAGEAGE